MSGTLVLIVLSVVYEFDVNGVNIPFRCSEMISVGRNIQGRWINVEIVSQTLIISYKIIIVHIRYGTTSSRKGQATIGHPWPHRLDIER